MTLALEVFDDADAVARRAADWLLSLAQAKDGPFALCLSGGSTPRRLYALLAAPPFRDAFPWLRTHLFWGDERLVPHDHPDSNYRMVREALLAHVPIPPENIHPIPTDVAAADAASVYERTLRAFHARDPAQPLFDITLLGLGTDGHTASLFPGVSALDERDRWAAAVVGAKPEARITLTYPALESSRRIAFLVTGDDKRAVLARIRAGTSDDPAARIRGDIVWFADRAAAP
jgi:6-phosphogluconolactonase